MRYLILLLLLVVSLPLHAQPIRFRGDVTIKGGVTASYYWVPAFGAEEIILNNATLVASLGKWIDGTIGVRKSGTTYEFYAVDAAGGAKIGKATGTLANPYASGTTTINISGVPGIYNYAAGGPIYWIDASTGLMMLHLERDPGNGGYYSSLGMAKTSNAGVSWAFLGEIVRPTTTFAEYSTCSCHFDVGGGTFQIVNDFMYVYYSDFRPNGTIQFITVARAPLASVLSAAASNTVTTFNKYNGGTWTELGIGGLASEVGDGSYSLFHSVMWNTTIQRFIMATMGCCGGPGLNRNTMNYLVSSDGVNWTGRRTVTTTCQPVYPSLISSGNNPLEGGRTNIYIYYIYSANECAAGPSQRFTDHVLARINITY